MANRDAGVSVGWSPWSSWQRHTSSRAEGTVTWRSSRVYWETVEGRPKATRTEYRYKTERSPIARGEPVKHVPKAPPEDLPVKTELSHEYIEPQPTQIVTLGFGESSPTVIKSLKDIKSGQMYVYVDPDTGQHVTARGSTILQKYEEHIDIGRSPIRELRIVETERSYHVFPSPTGVSVIPSEPVEIFKGGISGFLSGGPEFAYESLFRPVDEYFFEPWTPKMFSMVEGKKTSLEKMWSEGDIPGLLQEVLEPPYVGIPLIVTGTGMLSGILKTTSIGQKVLLTSRGVWETGTRAGKPLYSFTVGQIPETVLFSYGAYETGKGLYESPFETFTSLAVTMPFVVPFYRIGHRWGMGWVQRKAALSKTVGLDRVRQTGLYESWDVVSGLDDVKWDRPFFDLSDIKKISPDTALTVSRFLTGEQKRLFFSSRPRIGGSTSMKIQYGEFFRTGDYPLGLRSWAESRQLWTWKKGYQIGSGPKPLVGVQPAIDLDLLVLGRMGGLDRAGFLKRFDVHVHTYKVGEYLWGGTSQLPSTKGYISPFQKVSLLSPREQFIRAGISLLPSETRISGYRTYKDVGTWFDIGDILSFQKGGGRLRAAMDKVIHPYKYPIPRVTFGEKIFGRISSGAFQELTPAGEISYILPEYPSYPTSYGMGIVFGKPSGDYDTEGYTKRLLPPLAGGYPVNLYDVKPVVSIPFGKPVGKKDGFFKYPIQQPHFDIVPEYKPPPPFDPDYVPPPPPPEYPPPIYPESVFDKKVVKETPMKFGMVPVFEDKKTVQQGFDVFVKDRYIVSGKKKYREKYVKVNKRPLSRMDALGFGAELVDNSAAVSFRIKPIPNPPGKRGIRVYRPPINVRGWNVLSHMFDVKHGKKKTGGGVVFVEKNLFRINTRGEVEGISALGWLSHKKKKGKGLMFLL